MLAEARHHITTRDTDTDLDLVVSDIAHALITRSKRGHTGEIAYLNGGGKLFEQFVLANIHYSQYHAEIRLISAHLNSIVRDLSGTEHLIIVGQGSTVSFENKELRIAEGLVGLKSVTFNDLNGEFNRQAEARIASSDLPHLQNAQVQSFRMDYRDVPSVVKPQGKTAVLMVGGLIANPSNPPLDGFPVQEMQSALITCRKLAGDDGYVMLGYDTNTSEMSLARAYDSSLGPFLKNIVKIIAVHTPGLRGFDPNPDNFSHESKWNRDASLVEHSLRFEKAQHFTMTHQGQIIPCFFDAGDKLILMTSVKPSQQKMTQLGSYAGLEMVNGYSDKHGLMLQTFQSVPRPF